jgi:hypothetical protein
MPNELICEIFAMVWIKYQNGDLGFEPKSFSAIKKGTVPGAYLTAAAVYQGLAKHTDKGLANLENNWNNFCKKEFTDPSPEFSTWEEFHSWAKTHSN